MSVEAKLNARDTPAGRRFEASVVFYDCLILVVGVVGVALNFAPLIYFAAVGHLAANFFMAPMKWLWPLLEAVTLVIAAALFFGALYVVQVFWFGFPSEGVIGFLKSAWPQHLATAIVIAGVIGNLLAYPGNLDQLVQYLNRDATSRHPGDGG